MSYQVKMQEAPSVPVKLIDKEALKEYDGFELAENNTLRLSNQISLSAFNKASHRLRSMALIAGDVFTCEGRFKA